MSDTRGGESVDVRDRLTSSDAKQSDTHASPDSIRQTLIEVVEKAAQDWLHPASWVRHDNGEPLNVNALAAAVVDALRVERSDVHGDET